MKQKLDGAKRGGDGKEGTGRRRVKVEEENAAALQREWEEEGLDAAIPAPTSEAMAMMLR
jgi:hypothetical protein